MGRLPTSLLIASLFAAVPASAAANERVVPITGLLSAADAVVAGPDGAMWATLSDDPGRIARITTAGTVTHPAVGGFAGFPLDRQPSGLAREGGALWFLLAGGPDTFARLQFGGPDMFSLAAGRPTGLAGGSDGALWMTVDGGSGDPDAIVRFTPPTELAHPLDASSEPRSIIAGSDGALWFVDSGGARIGRITTGGDLTFQAVGSAPAALASGPGGSLWYAQGAVVRRLGDAAAYATGTPAAALAAGPDGAVWAAVRGGAARIVAGEAVSFVSEDIDPAAEGVAIAAGPDGRMWLALDRAPYLVKITVPPRAHSAAEDDGWLSATVNPNGLPARVSAELRQADGAWRVVAGRDLAAGTEPETVRLRLAHLSPGANLVRMTATTSAGSASTGMVTVHVPVEPAPSPAPEPTPTPTPGPVEGESVSVAVVSGKVNYRIPPSSTYRRLTGTAVLPLGVLLDTTAGKVAVASQVDGATQTGNFNGGKFTVAQTSTGMTEMALAGPLSCTPSDRAEIAQSKKKPKKKPKPKKRLLWGSDSGGSFRTRGNGAVATVRGTEWRTEDTCAGTTVYVRKGAVSVWPRRGGRSKLVRAGQRFFSPRPR